MTSHIARGTLQSASGKGLYPDLAKLRRILTAGSNGSTPNTAAELILESFYVSVLGGSAVVLFFLFIDLLDGQPLFTPSLMGSVLFHGVAAQDVATVRLDAVALFSIVHIAAFLLLGAAISFLVHEVELRARHPFLALLVFFAILEAFFFVAAPLALPGVIARVGATRFGLANLLAAGTIVLFFALTHRRNAKTWQKLEHTTADLIFDSFYAGALGGAAVALFFLFVDLLDGQPLFTPSLMGSVLFHGVAAQDVATVRLDAVAYFSIVHMAGFGFLGAAISFLVHEVELHARRPILLLFVLFTIIEALFFVAAPLALPGVVARVGALRFGLANLLAAGVMALFFVLAHREGAWERFKRAVRPVSQTL